MADSNHQAEVYANPVALSLDSTEGSPADAKQSDDNGPNDSEMTNRNSQSVSRAETARGNEAPPPYNRCQRSLATYENPAFDSDDVTSSEIPSKKLTKLDPDKSGEYTGKSLHDVTNSNAITETTSRQDNDSAGVVSGITDNTMGNLAGKSKGSDGVVLSDGNMVTQPAADMTPDEKTMLNDNHTKTVEIPMEKGQLDDLDGRETWGKKFEFLLAVVGFAVDLGNVWRFPYICYRNGGGAFLIPYLVMLIFGGLPLFYMELALGQFQRCGCISVWKRICPMFKGIGFGICFIATYVAFYYNTIIAWAVYYMFASMRSEVPWTNCNNSWNTDDCVGFFNRTSSTSNTSRSAAEEFFNRAVLEVHRSTGIDDVGPIKWSIALCLLAVFIIVYFSLWKGIKSSGKAVWVTATMPYIVLFVLLIRGVTLPGSLSGIIYYLKPNWSMLLEVSVWNDAAAQIFFSLGPGFGVLLALSSYNKFHNNCYKDALITSSINCGTSFLSGFVVFSVLGYMSYSQGKEIQHVAEEGPGLVFVAYPEAIATLHLSTLWAIIFFFMLITLGLDSTFGGLEAMITGICDEWPNAIGKRREIFVGVICVYCFLGGLCTTTYGGSYVLNLLDQHAAPISILFIVFVEAIAVNWFYGVNRFSDDIEQMLGFRPGIFWRVCWAGISPIFLLTLFVLTVINYGGIYYPNYEYPPWATIVGWLISCSSICCIPLYIVYRFIITPGNVVQRIQGMIRPEDKPKHEEELMVPMQPVYL
ncbi:sodium-dependent serotonin transporter-like isoform X2 [Lineus longissimus]|uniref:sodium-dependent serotonin transporter-like isoform X2 n=1 Tax=Lineus longissimus TaxID=88925 RepID=UPI00315CFC9D